jgi:serine/threonine kinase PknH
MSLPPVANIVDAAALADELARFRVVDAARLNELLAGFSGRGAAALAEYLVVRGALTAFEAERALAGEARVLALGPYRLTGPAGSGTFGPLYAARHASKSGAFVVRVLPLRSLWKAKQAKQLARTLSAGIAHPAVAPLIDADSANGCHYLVWPRVEGTRLVDWVGAAGSLPPGDAAALLGHLAGALAACHARGAVHGALTPHAVAIGPSGLPLLLELGAGALLAENVAADESLFDSMSAAFAAAGVLTFAAPELADAPDAPAPPADQYALGAVGYFALTGLPPYPHPALADQLRAKRAGPPPSVAIVNPAVPAELAAVIERMMAPAPADRFAALGEVEERFAALVLAEPGPEPPPTKADSLMLSKIRALHQAKGAVSWAGSRSSAVRPPARDDSDASVTFDLPPAPEPVPDAPETVPDAIPPQPARSGAPEPELLWASVDTPDEVPLAAPSRGEASAPSAHEASAARRAADPRLAAPTPVQWHPAEGPDDTPEPEQPNRPSTDSVLWKKVKRNLLFWQAPTDLVQVSVFGPTALVPGQSVKLVIYLHTSSAGASVRTLARAFQQSAELLGTGYLTREVPRGSSLAVHLSIANAGVAKALVECAWRGQPQRIGFDLHVPWESPEGASPGLVSVGHNNVRIGKIEFRLNVLPRKA